MSHALVNRVKPLTGFTFAEKSILFQLADASYDGETAFLRMDKLTLYAGCSLSTAKRALRSLERRGTLIPQGEKGGRGTVHVWRICIALPALPELQPETNGVNGHHTPPDVQPHVDDAWWDRRPDENVRDYARRIRR